jgi:hypothetical protein
MLLALWASNAAIFTKNASNWELTCNRCADRNKSEAWIRG